MSEVDSSSIHAPCRELQNQVCHTGRQWAPQGCREESSATDSNLWLLMPSSSPPQGLLLGRGWGLRHKEGADPVVEEGKGPVAECQALRALALCQALPFLFGGALQKWG